MKDVFLDKVAEEAQVSHPNIVQIFGKERLEEIQNTISKASGIAFVTVDYKGEPVTESTNFTGFCRRVRDNAGTCVMCKRSDAFGAIQSAISMKPSVYFCPCGLLEVAIPLEDNGVFLGGFIGGQIKCSDAPADLANLSQLFKQDLSYVNSEEMLELKKNVNEYSYEHFLAMANLVQMIIKQMYKSEKRDDKYSEEIAEKLESDAKERRTLEEKRDLLEHKIVNLKMFHNQYFMANVLSSISSLLVLEQTDKANSLVLDLAEFNRNAKCTADFFWTVDDEIAQIKRYIHLSGARFGDNFSYNIKINNKIKSYRLPANLLLPYVESAFFHGLAMREDNMKLSITGILEADTAVITIEENGPGLTDDEMQERLKMYGGHHEGKYIEKAMYYSDKKFRSTFGKAYIPEIKINRGTGRQIIIRIPAMIAGGMDSE